MQFYFAALRVEDDEGQQIRAVGHMGLALFGIQRLNVAMVGGDRHKVAPVLLSAQWNWVLPASLKGFRTFSGAKAMGRSLNLSWYIVMMTNSRSGMYVRWNCEKSFSTKASVSSISRPPRRQQNTMWSPSLILPTGAPVSSSRHIGSRE